MKYKLLKGCVLGKAGDVVESPKPLTAQESTSGKQFLAVDSD